MTEHLSKSLQLTLKGPSVFARFAELGTAPFFSLTYANPTALRAGLEAGSGARSRPSRLLTVRRLRRQDCRTRLAAAFMPPQSEEAAGKGTPMKQVQFESTSALCVLMFTVL